MTKIYIAMEHKSHRMVWKSNSMTQCWISCDSLRSKVTHRARREAINQWNQSNPVLKKGLALTPLKFGIAFTATHLNQAGALIHVYTDGTLQVSHGGTEMGQGLHTKIQQIVAQSFGIDINKVLVTSTRTDKVPNTSPTAASSGADLNGMAAHNAAMEIKQRLLDFARTLSSRRGRHRQR
ncbi:molybdopterin-dependent oxidoreductase [Vibrio sp. M60_M31a]